MHNRCHRKIKIEDALSPSFTFFHTLRCFLQDMCAPPICEMSMQEQENVCFIVPGHLVLIFQHAELILHIYTYMYFLFSHTKFQYCLTKLKFISIIQINVLSSVESYICCIKNETIRRFFWQLYLETQKCTIIVLLVIYCLMCLSSQRVSKSFTKFTNTVCVYK